MPEVPRWKRLLIKARPIVVTILILTAVRSAIADWNDVPSGSMNPSIIEGDRVFVNKLAYDLKIPFTTFHLLEWSGPSRGDIVVFYSPSDGTRLIKRVVGLPGDVLEMRNEQLYVNGKKASYAPLRFPPGRFVQKAGAVYASETIGQASYPMMVTPATPAKRWFGPLTVPQDSYFMLGDNRDNSADSRYIGFVPRENIVGQAKMIVLSLDYDNWSPRWSRFFTKLP